MIQKKYKNYQLHWQRLLREQQWLRCDSASISLVADVREETKEGSESTKQTSLDSFMCPTCTILALLILAFWYSQSVIRVKNYMSPSL